MNFWDKLLENITSFKFWVLVAATALVFFAKIEGGQWMYIALAIIGGRVGEYIWNKKG